MKSIMKERITYRSPRVQVPKSSNEHEQEIHSLPNKLPNSNDERLLRLINNLDLNGLKDLFESDPQIDLLEVATPDGKSALHYAVIKNDEGVINYILSTAVYILLTIE